MESNKILHRTLIISLVIHSVIIIQGAHLLSDSYPRLKPKQEKLQVRYLKLRQHKAPPPPQPRHADALLPNQHAAKTNSPFTKKTLKTSFKPHTLRESERQILWHKPLLGKQDIITVKKKITIPAMDSPPINNPSYIRYYQIVREQIKRSAYRAYAGREKGEVAVTFVVTEDGVLDAVSINTEKSSRSEYLRSIGLRSIRDASPFPRFPDELKEYSRLSFNVSITYESD